MSKAFDTLHLHYYLTIKKNEKQLRYGNLNGCVVRALAHRRDGLNW